MSGWAFAQLHAFVAYKATQAGVPLKVVNAAYTSQTCAACGHVDPRNRSEQSVFVCTACNADVNTAQNIAARAHVKGPQVSLTRLAVAA